MLSKDGTGEGTACTDKAINYCSRPIFTDYVGFAPDVEFKCGACAGGTVDVTCKQCLPLTDDLTCNQAPELSPDFKCYTYEFKDGAYDKTTRTCKRLKTSPVVCNQPAEKDTPAADYTSVSGCGPCPTDSTGKCKSCQEELCNGATSRDLSALLAVIAVVYVLSTDM